MSRLAARHVVSMVFAALVAATLGSVSSIGPALATGNGSAAELATPSATATPSPVDPSVNAIDSHPDCQGSGRPLGQTLIHLYIRNLTTGTAAIDNIAYLNDLAQPVSVDGRHGYSDAVTISTPSDTPLVGNDFGCYGLDYPLVQFSYPQELGGNHYNGLNNCGYSSSLLGGPNTATCGLFPLGPAQYQETLFYIQVPTNRDSTTLTVHVGPEQSLWTNTYTLTIPINRPNLTAHLTAPSSVQAGSDFVYVATVANTGLGGTSGPVEAQVDLPLDGLSSVGAISTSSGTCTYNHPTAVWPHRTVACNFGALAAGGTATASITASASGTLDNYLAFNTADPNGRISETDETDNTGSHFLSVVNDTVAPVITGSALTADGSPYAAGTWTKQTVTVSFTCTDNPGGTGVLLSSGPTSLTGDGSNQSVTGFCTDRAGNSASATIGNIRIDKTPPQIVPSGRTAPNPTGWNNTDVILGWSCVDSLSGPTYGTTTQTISGAGANQSATGTCVDNAGNTASDSQGGVNIDKTPPQITFSGRTAANAAGWNNGDVTLAWACADGLSGPAAPSTEQTVGSEGINQSATGTCFDNAGNSASDSRSGINIDTTPPVIAYNGRTPANGAGWNNVDVILSWSCSDTLSLPVNTSFSQTVAADGANQSAIGVCTDYAGNSASDWRGGVNVDKTPPQIAYVGRTAPNAAGWNNTNVTLTWACTDGLSGPVAAAVTRTISGEGAEQAATAVCGDLADNTSADTQGHVSIDKTAPVITYSGNAAIYTVDQQVTIACSAMDAMSGIASTTCTTVTAPAYTFNVGANTISSSATDRAGNVGAGSTTFNLVVTPTTLCNLTQQFMRQSSRYQLLVGWIGPAAATLLNQAAAESCQDLASISLTPGQKLRLVAAYQRAVTGLARLGWITPDQATLLTRLSTKL